MTRGPSTPSKAQAMTATMISPSGLPQAPPPGRPNRVRRATAAQVRRRNDHLLAMSRVLGMSTADITTITGMPERTVQNAIYEARARHEESGGDDPAPAIDGPDFTRAEFLDTPLTDEPGGPRYLHHPDLKAWAEANPQIFRPDPKPAPIRHGIRRRRPAG